MRAGKWRPALHTVLLLARESPRRLVTAAARGVSAAVGGGRRSAER